MTTPKHFKVIFIGDTNTGKTSLISQHIYGQAGKTQNTVGIEFAQSTVTVFGKPVSLNIWDTAGQERYFSITQNYFRGSQGVFFVFDVTAPESLDRWLIKLSPDMIGNDVPKIVIGNKIDKISDQRIEEIKKEFTKKGEQKNFKFFLCSALNGTGVHEAFFYMAERLLSEELDVDRTEIVMKRKRKCC